MKKLTELFKCILPGKSSGLKTFALAGLIAITGATQTHAQTTLSTGLVHQYCLDGDAVDRVGGLNGTVVNATPTTNRLGIPGTAMDFGPGVQNAGKYISLPNNVWVNGDYTISGWIYDRAKTVYARFYEFGNGTNFAGCGAGTGSDNVFTCPGAGVSRTHYNSCGAVCNNTSNWFGTPAANTWFYLTVIQRGTNQETYINGVLTTTVAMQPPCNVTRTQNYFGRSDWTIVGSTAGDPFFDGKIDDVLMYNRALSSTEVGQLYQSTIESSACIDPVGPNPPVSCSDTCYWKVTGNNIIGGNNILGTLSNDNVQLFTNNIQRGIYTNSGNFGWNTMTPTAKLHVDVTGLTSTTGIRFQGLPTSPLDANVLTVDAAGNVHQNPYPTSTGSTNSCATINFVPKTSTTTGDMTCSQIYDDGTSVGIGTTGGFGYTPAPVFGTTPPVGALMTLDVNGLVRSTTFCLTSDRKFKTNITVLENSLDKVLKLKSVEYNWKQAEFPNKHFDGYKHSGFIAQEVAEILPNSVIVDEKGDYAVDYISIIPVLTQAIQEQQKQIEELKSLVQKQGSNNTDMANATGGYLAQNVPNPFTASTIIKYELPKGAHSATIGVYDMNGKEIKLFQLASDALGSITIQGGDLMPGMYLYSLIVDGKYFDSKKMILTSQ